MTAPTKHDQAAMRVRAKRTVRDMKPKLWLDMSHPTLVKRWVELLANTDFETAGAGGADVLGSWSEIATVAPSAVVHNNTDQETGTYCCELQIAAGNQYAGVRQTVMTVGRTYTLIFRAKSSVNGKVMKLTAPEKQFTLTTSYQTFTHTFVATQTYMELARYNAASSSIYIDYAFLTEVTNVAGAEPVYTVTARDALSSAALTQATASLRPAYEAETLSIVLDGSDDYLEGATTPATGASGRFMAIVRTDAASSEQVIYSQSDKDAANVFLSLSIDSTNVIKYDYSNGATRDTIIGNTELGTGWHLLEWASTGSAVAMWVDGVAQELTASAGSNNGNWFGDLTNDDVCTLGVQRTSAGYSLYLDGNIRSVVALEPDESAGNVGRLRSTLLNLASVLALGAWFLVSQADLYSYDDPDNGASAVWTSGNTCIVRDGTKLIATGFEPVAEWEPLSNVRYTVWEKDGAGDWAKVFTDTSHTREPCPLIVKSDGTAWVSEAPADDITGVVQTVTPKVRVFPVADLGTPTAVHVTTWDGTPNLYTNSYRTLVTDRADGKILSIYNAGWADETYWSYGTGAAWSNYGSITWPYGDTYETPQYIRLAYPAVQMTGGAVHYLGVSDIVEPVTAWKDFKFALTGSDWDYDFRRLFYTTTSDITSEPFSAWLEVSSREATCGWITPCDIHVDGSDVHILWVETAIDTRLRSTFFPTAVQSYALVHAVIQGGEVVHRHNVVYYEEGELDQQNDVRFARFQVTASGRLFIAYYDTTYAPGVRTYYLRMVEVQDGFGLGTVQTLPITDPLFSWYTASPRFGNLASDTMDMLGEPHSAARTVRHMQLQLIGSA